MRNLLPIAFGSLVLFGCNATQPEKPAAAPKPSATASTPAPAAKPAPFFTSKPAARPAPAPTPQQAPYQAPRRPPQYPADELAFLAQVTPPLRERIRQRYRYDRAISTTRIPGLRYYFYEPQGQEKIVGFSLRNTGSPSVNPIGLKKRGVLRQFTFLFADQARENIYLSINDDVKVSGRFSHDNMFREMLFFPRDQLPSLRVNREQGLVDIILPTGEPVHFDQKTMEIVGGVLKESPIDMNSSRYLRHNPKISYQGDYLAITVAQRGESPRRAEVWGEQKFATAFYPSQYPKPCKFSPKHLFDQKPKPGDTEPRLHMLYGSDEEVYRLLEQHCQWNLAPLRLAAPYRGNVGI